MTVIRAARAFQATELAGIGLRAWQQAVKGLGLPATAAPDAGIAFSEFAAGHWHLVTVAERDGRIAGWAACEGRADLVSDLWVDPSFQGGGVGTALLAAIEAEILARGFERVRVETHAGNVAAIGFFRARGYKMDWLSVAFAARIGRDVETVGLSKPLLPEDGPSGSAFL